MAETSCACDRFERLTGVATSAYLADFLERTGAEADGTTTYYRCRVCGRPWKCVKEEGERRPTLIRLETKSNV